MDPVPTANEGAKRPLQAERNPRNLHRWDRLASPSEAGFVPRRCIDDFSWTCDARLLGRFVLGRLILDVAGRGDILLGGLLTPKSRSHPCAYALHRGERQWFIQDSVAVEIDTAEGTRAG